MQTVNTHSDWTTFCLHITCFMPFETYYDPYNRVLLYIPKKQFSVCWAIWYDIYGYLVWCYLYGFWVLQMLFSQAVSSSRSCLMFVSRKRHIIECFSARWTGTFHGPQERWQLLWLWWPMNYKNLNTSTNNALCWCSIDTRRSAMFSSHYYIIRYDFWNVLWASIVFNCKCLEIIWQRVERVCLWCLYMSFETIYIGSGFLNFQSFGNYLKMMPCMEIRKWMVIYIYRYIWYVGLWLRYN